MLQNFIIPPIKDYIYSNEELYSELMAILIIYCLSAYKN